MSRHPGSITTVADGVLKLTRAETNCYLVVERDVVYLVDAGLPRTWPLLASALSSVGATLGDVSAVYLTHGHFDHVGMCDRLVDEHHVAVHVHESDRTLVRHPYRYAHEKARLPYPLRHPSALALLGRMAAAGALAVKGVTARGDVRPGVAITGTGGLTPVFSPGHTDGHCAFFHQRSGILFSGDALVTLDPYTGAHGPRVVAGAATKDSAQALASLDALRETDARIVLPGHGDAYDDGIRTAVTAARAAGPA